MNPDQIHLEDISKLFEYEKLSRDIDSIDDIAKFLRTTQNLTLNYT